MISTSVLYTKATKLCLEHGTPVVYIILCDDDVYKYC